MPLMRLLIASVFVVLSAVAGGRSRPMAGGAPNYYILDVGSGQVLAQQNADIPLPPASMSKLMTLAMLFDALSEGRVALDTTWSISTRVHAMGGSSMFLETRDRPTTEELIRGLVIVSGNDAAVAIAEGLGGTEEAFAQMAQARAVQIGMTQTTIANASGWPDPRHRMSLHDLARAGALSGGPSRRPLPLPRRNQFPVERHHPAQPRAAAGRGSGWTGLAATPRKRRFAGRFGAAGQSPHHLCLFRPGQPDRTLGEAERIIGWAFRQFVERRVLESGQTIAEADVWLGAAPAVPLVAASDLSILAPTILPGDIAARLNTMARSPRQSPPDKRSRG